MAQLMIGLGLRRGVAFCDEESGSGVPRLVNEVNDLGHLDLRKGLSASIEGFLELDCRLLHPLVRLVRTPDEKKVLGPRDAFMPVSPVQADAKQAENPSSLVLSRAHH